MVVRVGGVPREKSWLLKGFFGTYRMNEAMRTGRKND